MKYQEGTFSSKNDQTIYYQAWLPEGNVKATVLILHGLNEHSGRYKHLAGFLTDNNYAVYALDHPGHGKSSGLRSFVNSYQDLMSPIQTFLEMVKSWQNEKPVYLLGHSMGGLLCTAFLADHPGQLNGGIISGPLVKVPDYVSDMTVKLGEILSTVLPKLRLQGVDLEGLSRDPAVVQAYIDDPLVYTGKTTIRLSNVLNNAITLVEEKGPAIQVPLLLLHGGADGICDPAWSTYLHDLVASEDKQLIVYDGLYHEILNEPESETVFGDILTWLENHAN